MSHLRENLTKSAARTSLSKHETCVATRRCSVDAIPGSSRSAAEQSAWLSTSRHRLAEQARGRALHGVGRAQFAYRAKLPESNKPNLLVRAAAAPMSCSCERIYHMERAARRRTGRWRKGAESCHRALLPRCADWVPCCPVLREQGTGAPRLLQASHRWRSACSR